MPELDFPGLGQAAEAAFRPHFPEVERRARRRRRRTRVAGATVLVAVVAAGGAVVSTSLTGGGGGGITGQVAGPGQTPDFLPAPRASVPPGEAPGRSVKTGTIYAGDLRNLYLRYRDCKGEDCAIMLAATADGGHNWRTSPIPVPNNSLVGLQVIGPRTLLAEVQTMPSRDGVIDSGAVEQFWLASTDGGANWRKVEIGEVDVLPATFRPLPGEPGRDSLTVLAADPATGQLARLAKQVPLRNARVLEGLPVSAGLWVSGYTDKTVGPVQELDGSVSQDKVTYHGSAIEVSHDGGRTWRRSALPVDLTGGGDDESAALAVHGDTGYAVGQADGVLRVFRSEDRGLSWQPTAAREQVGERLIDAGVRADGTLLVQAGVLAGEDPIMFSGVDRGEALREIEVGPGASAVAVPGGYAQTGNQDSFGAWLSEDGITWSYVGPPTIQ